MFNKKPVKNTSRKTSAATSSRLYSRENVSRYSQRARQRDRSRRIKRIVLSTIVGVLVCGTAAAGLWLYNITSKMHNGEVITSDLLANLADSNVSSDPFYVLLLGTDGRPGEDSYRSDSIILARIDPKEKQATLISIPRDTKVTYKGSTIKINAAHSMDGATGMVDAVNDLLFDGEQKISHYAEVNFDGMKTLIDSVGGIDITVPEGDEVSDREAGPVDIEAGEQHMDGEAALTFSRARHQFADGDYTRMRHQRMVLGALAKQVLNNFDATKLVSLINSLSDMIITDMEPSDIVSIINSMRGMDVDNIYSANLPSYAGEDTMINGVSYVFVYEDELKSMMERVDAGKDPEGPQTMGKSGSGGTVGDLSNNSTKDWSNGTATTTDSSSDEEDSDSSSS